MFKFDPTIFVKSTKFKEGDFVTIKAGTVIRTLEVINGLDTLTQTTLPLPVNGVVKSIQLGCLVIKTVSKDMAVGEGDLVLGHFGH
jgi:hypothetical protein